MKSTKRALRRHHRQRMIRRALRSLVLWDDDPDWQYRRALRWYNNLKMCACWMCGNPRKRKLGGHITFQERKLLLGAEEDAGSSEEP